MSNEEAKSHLHCPDCGRITVWQGDADDDHMKCVTCGHKKPVPDEISIAPGCSIESCAYAMVKEFQEKIGTEIPDEPTAMAQDAKYKATSKVIEEVNEVLHAQNLVDQVHEMIDVVYAALGCFVRIGVDPSEIFAIVHRSNMSKQIDGEDVTKTSEYIDPKPLIAKCLAEKYGLVVGVFSSG